MIKATNALLNFFYLEILNFTPSLLLVLFFRYLLSSAMDQNRLAPSSTLESPNPITKSLNPLDIHEIQEIFYDPCKQIREKLEMLNNSCDHGFFSWQILKAALESIALLMTKPDIRRIIQEMDQRSYINVDPRVFGNFFPIMCQTISDIKKKSSDVLIQSSPCIPSIEKDASILREKWKRKSEKLIPKLHDIFVGNFTEIGLGRIDFITSWLCYASVRFLEAVKEILFLKVVEEDKLQFSTRAEAILQAMEDGFKQELLSTLQILNSRK